MLTIQPGSEFGQSAFVKLDAVAQVGAAGGVDGDGFVLQIVHDASAAASVPINFNARSPRGTLTWATQVSGGGVETFRLRALPAGAECLPFFPCVTYFVRAQMSAISAPFGASGGATLH